MDEYYPVTGPDYFAGPDNSVNTILYLSGTEDALREASELIRIRKAYESPSGAQEFYVENITEGEDGKSIWFEIIMDNFIPQIYDKLNSIEGLEPVIFVCYCDYDRLLYTNDTKGILTNRRRIFGIPTELEVEIIESYPDTFDLASLNYKN